MAPRRRIRALAAHIVGSRPAAAELAVDELAYEPYVHGSAPDPHEEVPASPWHDVPLFDEGIFPGLSAEQKATMDMDGHVVLPGAPRQLSSLSSASTYAASRDPD